MKNNKTFIKKWKLNGLPYQPAELREESLQKALQKKLNQGMAEVWLTDNPHEARRLIREGSCVVCLLTTENRTASFDGLEWCAEVPQNVEEWRDRLLCAEREGLPEWLPEEFLWRVWLRRYGLPWHIWETDRLTLREMTETDLDFLYEMQEDEESARFLDSPDSDHETQRQKLTAYRQQMYGFFGFGIWIVLEKESGERVGRAGLQMRDGFEEPELGFAIAKKYRQRGYAKEACEGVLHYAQQELDLKKVRAVADLENIKSQRLCEKLGFAVDNAAEMDGEPCIFYSRNLGNEVSEN